MGPMIPKGMPPMPGGGGAPPPPRPMGGGAPPSGMGGPPMGTEDALRSKRSIFSGPDMAMAKQSGELDNMSLRDFFSQAGVDVDGPVTQLLQFVTDQMKNADPLEKMKGIAGSTPPMDPLEGGGMPPGGPPPRGGQPGGMGGDPLDRLMGQ